jgi:hypothetical protein
VTLDEIRSLRILIEAKGAPLSPMLIFTLLDHLEDATGALDRVRDYIADPNCCGCCNEILQAIEGP